jgi:hypothetical protein
MTSPARRPLVMHDAFRRLIVTPFPQPAPDCFQPPSSEPAWPFHAGSATSSTQPPIPTSETQSTLTIAFPQPAPECFQPPPSESDVQITELDLHYFCDVTSRREDSMLWPVQEGQWGQTWSRDYLFAFCANWSRVGTFTIVAGGLKPPVTILMGIFNLV